MIWSISNKMTRRIYIPHYIFSVILMLLTTVQMHAQEIEDTTEAKPITHTEDRLLMITTDTARVDSLLGQVKIFLDSTVMYCDTAVIYDEVRMKAFGNVAIVQRDTTEIFSDTLYYDSATNIADLIGRVVLQNGDETLVTEKLKYDLNTDVGTYLTGASVRKNDIELTSTKGQYYVQRRIAIFSERVRVIDSSFLLWTDSLQYDLKQERAVFYGPTRVNQEDADIYSTGGFYIIPEKAAKFEGSAQYVKDTISATAESIFYDGNTKEVILQDDAKFRSGTSYGEAIQIVYNEQKKTSVLTGEAFFRTDQREVKADVIEYDERDDSFTTRGRTLFENGRQILEADGTTKHPDDDFMIVQGNVILNDTMQKMLLKSEYLKNYDATGISKAYNDTSRPILMLYPDGDTLYLAADTLISDDVRDTLGDYQTLDAIINVKLFQESFQATSGSFHYSSRDGIFKFKEQPLIWVDSTQFSADTIDIIMDNNQVEKMLLYGNSMIISQSLHTVFDQIKGRDIEVWLSQGKIDSLLVDGNAESIYFLKDDDEAYIGADETQCSRIKFKFSEGDLKEIYTLNQPVSTFIPMQQINLQELLLDGFIWQIAKRPLSKRDLTAYDP